MAAIITKGYVFDSTELVTNAKLHTLVDSATISGIVNAEIATTAAIVDTKLAAISTAGKVDGAAIVNIGNIPAMKDINPTNLLSNGDFENWSAGTSVAPDGWTDLSDGTIAREASIIKLGTYSVKFTTAGTGHEPTLRQRIDLPKGIAYWRGRKVTFGVWIYSATATRGRIFLYDGIDSTLAIATLTNTYEFISVTRTIDPSATAVYCYLDIQDGTALDVYYDGAMCVEGESAFVFSDKPVTLGGRYGTFVANGTTPVTITNANVAISDCIVISLNTVGGTVGVQPHVATITAATGFTVVCTASDTSTYNYCLIKQ